MMVMGDTKVKQTQALIDAIKIIQAAKCECDPISASNPVFHCLYDAEQYLTAQARESFEGGL